MRGLQDFGDRDKGVIKGRSKDISRLHHKTYGFTSKERNTKL